MGIISNIRSILKDAKEYRASGNVNDPVYWQNFFQQFGVTSLSNQTVTPDTAMQLAVVFACVRVLAETIASLPLMVYKRRADGGKEPATTNDLYFLLHDQPNPDQTSFEFREMIMGHLALRGNAYSYIERTGGGGINALYPLNPARMQVSKNRGELFYQYMYEDGKSARIPTADIWHIRGLSNDGIVGLSPISMAKEAIGLAMASEQYGAKFFANYAKPGLAITYPGKLNEDAAKELKASINDAQTGANVFKTMLLQGGLDIKQIGLSNEDSQFIELRQFQIEDICRIFRVPGVLINYTGDKSSTYASAEQFFISFITHTVRPWASRIEQSAARCLMTDKEKRKMFAEFNLNDFVRGDLESRYRAFQIGLQNGWLSPNDVRKLENLNPIESKEGDKYFMPLNIAELGSNPKVEEPKKDGDSDADKTAK
uniref:Putative portal protein n=3 Tax=viral metagenome TaxID=1070528 RepID=A0A6M3J752_9ZZZZ